MNMEFNAVERDTILAALRLWQRTKEIPQGILDIATNGGAHAVIEDNDIDELCERINCDEN